MSRASNTYSFIPVMNIKTVSALFSLTSFAASMPFMPSICMSRKMSNGFAAATSSSPDEKQAILQSGFRFSIISRICSRITISSSTTAISKLLTPDLLSLYFIYRQNFCTFLRNAAKGGLNRNERICGIKHRHCIKQSRRRR